MGSLIHIRWWCTSLGEKIHPTVQIIQLEEQHQLVTENVIEQLLIVSTDLSTLMIL